MTLLIRCITLAVTLGATIYVHRIHGPGIITASEATAVITIGSCSLVAHLTAGWASRGVAMTIRGERPRDARVHDARPAPFD